MKQGLGIRDWGLAGSPSAFSRRAHAARSGGNPSAICRLQSPRASLRTPHSVLRTRSSAFTLVELLVVISIIAILSAMSFEALQLAREAARERSTQATIAKLNNIILRRYESYVTRRVPIRIPPGTTPHYAARCDLAALRDLMRMEMPERWTGCERRTGALPHFGGGSAASNRHCTVISSKICCDILLTRTMPCEMSYF